MVGTLAVIGAVGSFINAIHAYKMSKNVEFMNTQRSTVLNQLHEAEEYTKTLEREMDTMFRYSNDPNTTALDTKDWANTVHSKGEKLTQSRGKVDYLHKKLDVINNPVPEIRKAIAKSISALAVVVSLMMGLNIAVSKI